MVAEDLQAAEFRVNVPGMNGGVRQQGKKAAAQLLQPSREGRKWDGFTKQPQLQSWKANQDSDNSKFDSKIILQHLS